MNYKHFTAADARSIDASENADFMQELFNTIEGHIKMKAGLGYNKTDLEFRNSICQKIKQRLVNLGFICNIEHFKCQPANISTIFISW